MTVTNTIVDNLVTELTYAMLEPENESTAQRLKYHELRLKLEEWYAEYKEYLKMPRLQIPEKKEDPV